MALGRWQLHSIRPEIPAIVCARSNSSSRVAREEQRDEDTELEKHHVAVPVCLVGVVCRGVCQPTRKLYFCEQCCLLHPNLDATDSLAFHGISRLALSRTVA